MTAPTATVHPAGSRPVRPRSTAGRRPTTRRRRSTPRRRRTSAGAGRWLPILLVAVAVLAGLAWRADDSNGPCTVPGTSIPLTAEQWTNAATIAEVGRSRGLPDRAIVIALATAQQESRLRNLDYGDRDSLGLFQQRPSQGWGTEAQVQDPVYAAGKFYDGLVQVPDWQSKPLTEASQFVQKSAFPDAYAPWQPMAEALSAALATSDPPALDCR